MNDKPKCGCVLREASFTPDADIDCLFPEAVALLEKIKALKMTGYSHTAEIVLSIEAYLKKVGVK